MAVVQFNRSVKVLGYYLSDEERALKQLWSAENHERMLALRKQIKRQKMIQMKENKQTKVNRSDEYSPLKSLDVLIDKAPSNSFFSSSSVYPTTSAAFSSRQQNTDEADALKQHKRDVDLHPIVLAKTGTTTADRRKHLSSVSSFSNSSNACNNVTSCDNLGAAVSTSTVSGAMVSSLSAASSSTASSAMGSTSIAPSVCTGRPRTMEVRLRPVPAVAEETPCEASINECERWTSYLLGVVMDGSYLAIETVRSIERKFTGSNLVSFTSDEWMEIGALSCLSNLVIPAFR